MYPFLVCFSLLDLLFWAHRDALLHDDLGILLGEMDPAICADGMPIDEAVLDDWNSIVRTMPQTDAEWLAAIDSYLRFYAENHGFDLDISRGLLTLPETAGKLPHAKKRAEQICRMHSY